MSETTNLRLFKHNEPLESNQNQFDIDLALNQNWDKIDDFADKVNDKVIEIEDKNNVQDTNINQNKTDIELLQENLADEITTEESENLTVKNAVRWYSKLDISGNSVQEQTENIPSPNSLSEIQNCGDNINFLDNKLITVGSINDVLNQEIQFSSNNARARFSRLIPLQENIDTFTISCNDKYTISIAEYNVDNLCIKTSSAWTDKYTFTKSKDTTQISIKFKKIDDSNFTQEELQEIKCKLEKGSKATEYSNYNCACISIKVQNKNYFDINNKNNFKYGLGSEKASINEDKTITTTSNFSSSRNKGTLLELQKNKEYTISFFLQSFDTQSTTHNCQMEIIAYKENNSIDKILKQVSVSMQNFKHSITFSSENYEKIALHISGWYGSGQSGTLTYRDVMIAEGTDTDCIEHEEQLITFPLKQNQKLMERRLFVNRRHTS